MTLHALVVDDNPAILEEVQDRLESLGHTCDSAENQVDARGLLENGRFSFALLDLEIPVRPGRPCRIANGQNLLREIRMRPGYRDFPIIVMTAHGRGSPALAVEAMKQGGATDFIMKPFSEAPRSLEKVIEDSLRVPDRCMPRATLHHKKAKKPGPPQSFEGGELVFYPSRVELHGVEICGGEDSSMMRRILDVLRGGIAEGRCRAFSGEEIASMVGTDSGASSAASAIRNIRNRVRQALLAKANVEIDPHTDLIINDGQHGYHFSDKITIVERSDLLASDSDDDLRVAIVVPDDSGHASTDDDSRARWILDELAKTGRVRKRQLLQRTGWSESTARRALTRLRDEDKIVFEGSARNGHWRLV